MKKRFVIPRKHLPIKLPVSQTLVYYLAMDYWEAPTLFVGAFSMLVVIVWVEIIWGLTEQEDFNFEDVEIKKLFKDKLSDALEKQKSDKD